MKEPSFEKEASPRNEDDPVFETDGMVTDIYLWMWLCDKCHSTLPPFMFEKEQTCPYCGKGTLKKAKVEEP